ncbi:MAG: hypothetical protein LBC61_00230 [Candidatus Peribacteria bacterium]|nr:hypothetical protein [Candidatus Peribacteria bacterium]
MTPSNSASSIVQDVSFILASYRFSHIFSKESCHNVFNKYLKASESHFIFNMYRT